MAGLQRSTETFRRSGSSGLVWEERFSSEDARSKSKEAGGVTEDVEFRELISLNSVGSLGILRRNLSNGGNRVATAAYTARKDSPTVPDPPSPKISYCGLCFGKPKSRK